MMTYSRKCELVANYIANNMTLDEMKEYIVDELYQTMKHGEMLEDYMEDYDLTEQHLEELGGV